MRSIHCHGPPADDGGRPAVPLGGDLQDREHAQRGDRRRHPRLFLEGWKLGLKALAIYRDGSKRTQPLSTSAATGAAAEEAPSRARRLPDKRQAITHKFSIPGHEGYVTVGIFDDGTPGELFITMAKEGSVDLGADGQLRHPVSLALQYGVPLAVFVDKFSHSRFEPSGFTNNPDIRIAKIHHRLHLPLAGHQVPARRGRPGGCRRHRPGCSRFRPRTGPSAPAVPVPGGPIAPVSMDAPPCPDCGSLMIRAGSCFRCGNCGGTSGCG